MDLGLAGRVYVLTGASRGLGFATASCLVADGARIVVSARDPRRVDEAVAALTASCAAGGRAIGIPLDNADPDAADTLIETATRAYGRIDGGLISVGGPPRGTAASIDDDQWRASFDTIFIGAVRLARTLANRLDVGGSIGFVLSTSVRYPIVGLGISNALRPGLAGVAKDMSDEYGPRGVRVFSLLPGSVSTDRLREIHAASGNADRARARTEATIPLRRLGQPDEFGRVAAFLLSPAASYLTGLSVPVDGGSTRGL